MLARLRSQSAFGMIELLISLTILNVGILAVLAAFNSGALALQRASRVSTASTLTDKQLELYRAVVHSAIALDATALATAQADATYTGDTAYSATQVTTTCASLTPQCSPRQTVVGPDGASYRVDTYIVSVPTQNGRNVKRVTVVVRGGTPQKTLARLTSTFDLSTG